MHIIEDFDTVLVTACDIHGVARGRFVFRESLPRVLSHGLGIAQAALFCGIPVEIPTILTEYSDEGWANGSIVPDLSTLKPLSWMSYGGQKVGHVLCDLLNQSREPEASLSRQISIQQLKALADLGYHVYTSLDLSFTVFPRASLIPVALHEDISRLLQTLTRSLSESGLPVVSVGRGLEPGQLLISLGELRGIAAVDNLHWLHCVLKSLCVQVGYDVSRMTRPVPGLSSNGCSYTMRLTTDSNRNVFDDSNSPDGLSDVARHWIAGILHHAPAVTSLARPTLNCYTGTDDNMVALNSWTTDELNRCHRLVVQETNAGMSVTDRLPSAASNPYIVFGALIAAGIEGILSKMELTDKAPVSENQNKIPPTLSDALLSLEEDKVFQKLIGPKFVHRFLALKREYETKRLEKRLSENKDMDMVEFERSLYLTSL